MAGACMRAGAARLPRPEPAQALLPRVTRASALAGAAVVPAEDTAASAAAAAASGHAL